MAWPGRFSRRRLLAAACGLWLGVAAAGQGPVLARVLELAPDHVTLGLEAPGAGAPARVEIPVAPGARPAGLEVGRLVRVWPGPHGLAADARLVPLESDLGGPHRGPDRTGVRARLMHGAGRGFGGGSGGR